MGKASDTQRACAQDSVREGVEGRRGPTPAFPPRSALGWRTAYDVTRSSYFRFRSRTFLFLPVPLKDGVPQGRHRPGHHFFQLRQRCGRERQGQRRGRRFGREAGADRRPGEWGAVFPGPRGERSSQLGAARRALAGSLPSGPREAGPRFSLKILLFRLRFLFGRRCSFLCHLSVELRPEKGDRGSGRV